MSKRIQLRRGTTAETNAFTGANGEVTVDTNKKTVVVHDGVTAGGFPVAAIANNNGTISLIKKDGTVITTISASGLFNNTLTSTATDQALTAAQGKVLQDNKLDKTANAVSATKLATARTINGTSFDGTVNITTVNWGTARTLSFTGDVTGSASVDGSANVATAMTLANSGVTAGTYKSVTVDAKGRVTAGTDIVTGLVTATTASGTANTATTNTNTFLNIVETVGATPSTVGTSTQITGAGTVTVTSDTAGLLTITGSQSITGNAATATKLATARTIGGVSFDGSANINLPGVNTTGNQNTTGNAATATNLTTASGSAPSYSARAWVNFDGTGTVAIRGSGNVSSITDNGVGDYTMNFITAMPDTNYAVIATAGQATTGQAGILAPYRIALTTGSVVIGTTNGSQSASQDAVYVNVAVFR